VYSSNLQQRSTQLLLKEEQPIRAMVRVQAGAMQRAFESAGHVVDGVYSFLYHT
jgi:hypothetical protein